MRKLFIAAMSLCVSLVNAQEYKVFMDLTAIVNDELPVEVVFEGFELEGKVEYQMPKMVPGTYSINNFGRVIKELKAYDAEGNELGVVRLDDNRWEIAEGSSLHRVFYMAEDTFDDPKYSDIFEPSGSNIEENNVLLNNFAFVGFLNEREKNPYKIRVKYPDHLYGASPMEREEISENEELFFADNYLHLTDSPIMYSLPDTASVMIDDTQVMVSVYSPSGASDAAFMMSKIEPTLKAQGQYLGGDLPVKKYVIMIYMHENTTNSGAMGALEHSYSTVFSYPDIDPSYLAQSIVDVTSHEFFHIITPLTIHSREIGDYDFIDPEMSKHLWLYEGVTEYSAMRVQVMYDLVTVDEFLDVIMEKMDGASGYNDSLPFTEMSLGALDVYENQYTNVYQKGALIGMCLDLMLLHYSEGEYDIRQLLHELGEMYGKDKSFEDEELFDLITEMTYPQVREFFARYVEGPEALPIEECLSYAGAEYLEGDTVYVNTLGNIALGYDPEKEALVVADNSNMDEFGESMGFESGDQLYKMQGEEMTIENYQTVLLAFYMMDEGEKLTVEVIRTDSKGKEKKKKLKGKVVKLPDSLDAQIRLIDEPNELQLKVRNAWMNKDQKIETSN